MTWDDVIELGLRFPGVEVSTSFGTPSLKASGKMMCRMRAGPDALVIRVTDMLEREAMVHGDPNVFFITPHYESWPYVLVRLEAVDPIEMSELVEEAWRIQSPKRVVKKHDASASAAPERGPLRPCFPPARVRFPAEARPGSGS